VRKIFPVNDHLCEVLLFYTRFNRLLINYVTMKRLNSEHIRLKDVQQEKYTQEEAERGAGKSIEVLPPVNASRRANAMNEDMSS
jgi:hypothetical protein